MQDSQLPAERVGFRNWRSRLGVLYRRRGARPQGGFPRWRTCIRWCRYCPSRLHGRWLAGRLPAISEAPTRAQRGKPRLVSRIPVVPAPAARTLRARCAGKPGRALSADTQHQGDEIAVAEAVGNVPTNTAVDGLSREWPAPVDGIAFDGLSHGKLRQRFPDSTIPPLTHIRSKWVWRRCERLIQSPVHRWV